MTRISLTLFIIFISILTNLAQNIDQFDRLDELNNTQQGIIYTSEFSIAENIEINADKGPTIGYSCNNSLINSEITNNGNKGIIFTVEAKQNLIITGFTIPFYNLSGYVRIYKSTYGITNTSFIIPSHYQLADSVYISKTSSSEEYQTFSLSYPIHILASEKMTFFIASKGPISISYNTGTALNAIAKETNELRLLEGIGLDASWSNIYTSRTFMGNIHYCVPEEILCDTIKNTKMAGNSGYGITFDIVAKANPIEVDKIITYITSNGADSIRLFTTNGSGLNKLANKAEWTEQVGYTLGTSLDNLPNSLTPVSKLTINAGDTLGIYIAINQPNSQTGSESRILYRDNSSYGSILSEDQNIQILSGTATLALFNSILEPREFLGTISYCIKEYTSLDEIENVNLQLYPNPSQEFININGLDWEMPYQIIDLQGKVQGSGTYKESTPINIQHLKNGFYILELKGKQSSKHLKFIKG